MLLELSKFIGGIAVASGIFAWLIKTIISHWLEKDVQGFKASLQSQTQLEIEKTKHELEKIATEHQIKFAKLHEKRADVILEMNKNIESLINSIQQLVSLVDFPAEPSRLEKMKKAGECLDEFLKHYRQNSIYLSENLSKKIKDLVDTLIKPAISFSVLLTGVNNDLEKVPGEKWEKAWGEVEKLVPEIRESIGKEFRSILGVN